ARIRSRRSRRAAVFNVAACRILCGRIRRCGPCRRPAPHIVGRDRVILAAYSAGCIYRPSREPVSRDRGTAFPPATKNGRPSIVQLETATSIGNLSHHLAKPFREIAVLHSLLPPKTVARQLCSWKQPFPYGGLSHHRESWTGLFLWEYFG